jgi:hypothetical protein
MRMIKARPNRVQSERHVCTLQEPIVTRSCYARFIGDSVDYVPNRLIEATLAKDRDIMVRRADRPIVR